MNRLTSSCGECGGLIIWQECPTGGWWYHKVHPKDGHDAESTEYPDSAMDDDGNVNYTLH